MATTIKVNGVDHSVDVDGDTPLLWVLRDVLGMTGTKFGCGMALCGACTVHVDGAPIRSCITPIDSIGTSDDHDDRGDRRDAGGREDPEGLARSRGRAVRLLPVGPDHVRVGAAREQSASDATPTSTTRCPATSAAAAPMSRIREAIKQAAQSSVDREADHDRRSTCIVTPSVIAESPAANGLSGAASCRPEPPPAAACC